MRFLIQFRAAAASVALLLAAAQGNVSGQSATEYELKAAFLFKFAGFVQWPENTRAGPICIGVVGQDPFGVYLNDAVREQGMNRQNFTVRHSLTPQNLPACQVVFISSSERHRVRQILNQLPLGILTVGDMPGFCESGGIIGFDLVDRRVRLRINLEAAQKARLQISSKLLSLAKVVGGISPRAVVE